MQTPAGRIQGCEQLISRIYASMSQLVEKRRFSRIRVSNQGYGKYACTLTSAPLRASLLPESGQLLLESLDPPDDQSPIHFQLRLTHATKKPPSSPLTLKMSPATHKTRRCMLKLGQFDL